MSRSTSVPSGTSGPRSTRMTGTPGAGGSLSSGRHPAANHAPSRESKVNASARSAFEYNHTTVTGCSELVIDHVHQVRLVRRHVHRVRPVGGRDGPAGPRRIRWGRTSASTWMPPAGEPSACVTFGDRVEPNHAYGGAPNRACPHRARAISEHDTMDSSDTWLSLPRHRSETSRSSQHLPHS